MAEIALERAYAGAFGDVGAWFLSRGNLREIAVQEAAQEDFLSGAGVAVAAFFYGGFFFPSPAVG